jgi:hypothetical protein
VIQFGVVSDNVISLFEAPGALAKAQQASGALKWGSAFTVTHPGEAALRPTVGWGRGQSVAQTGHQDSKREMPQRQTKENENSAYLLDHGKDPGLCIVVTVRANALCVQR